ncbi:uncharacterized protein H6S33_003023 [Morchella sextelata]|uniref:uncharacterized protein n=1 Tax=Morchella sextelata TaxID=1174677 RepID=UPI001D047E12|nr:uncharacterized protein H6S33_003023 [Morchella sextelata]KAH0607035.1 hypothetical protein H6S33_003023 [Morchella sextelata]
MSTSQEPIQVVTETGTGISMASSSTSFNHGQARLKEQPPQHTAHTNRLSTTMSRGSIGGGTASTKRTMWLGRGMVNDIRRRAPYYWSDWTDAWDYRIIPSTIYMFFAK